MRAWALGGGEGFGEHLVCHPQFGAGRNRSKRTIEKQKTKAILGTVNINIPQKCTGSRKQAAAAVKPEHFRSMGPACVSETLLEGK